MTSAVILTKNEENNLEKCLKQLLWCDEILVIDDNSTDKTVDIARKYNARVLKHQLNDFSSQRNFALEHAKGNWILFVDADEVVSAVLRREIEDVVSKDNKAGYHLKRVDFMWGKQLRHGETGDIKLLRLAKKDKGKWVGKVHERWQVKGDLGTLMNPLYHYPHATVSEFLAEINLYSTLRAEELREQKVHSGALQIIFYPKAKFFVNYIIELGFLDGVSGLVIALMMSLHSFLVRGKLWLLWQKKSG